MNLVRRLSLTFTAGLLGIAVLLGWVDARPRISRDAAGQLAAGASFFDSTIVLARVSAPRGARGDALTVSLGYLERLRLGLGDPFRLVDAAVRDPRVDPWIGSRLSWALLERARRGDAYVVDPIVLDGVGPWAPDGHGAGGAAHLALIERTIHGFADPRSGELAIRLAYAIAAARGSVSSNAPAIADEVAALVRDGALASLDLTDLLADTREKHLDVMSEIATRRAAHALRVEQPALTPLASGARIAAMNAVPALVAAIDTLDRVPAARSSASASPVIGQRFASRLFTLGAMQPPLAQVAVTLRGQEHSPLRATNEETLAAAHVLLGAGKDSAAYRRAALALLGGAVALRGYAQETPWFVGDAGPDANEVESEFGLARVSFTRTVPAAWQPYYLRELEHGLRDMLDVFPATSFAGLNVSIGTADLPDSALAMHNPRSRTIQLTIAGSGGTLAHELSHDLDWQTARRIFAVGGGYSTDRAVSEQRGALAASVRGLAEARTLRPLGASPKATLPDRPAELFARGADWFVATALAQTGAMNSFLTAIQDGALPGYAAGSPTAIGVAGANSLLSAIDQMTYISDSTRAAFIAAWSDPSTIDPLMMVRRVLATPVGRVMPPRDESAALRAMKSVSAPLCAIGASEEDRARVRLIALAIDARARGAALRRAHYHPGGTRSPFSGLLGVAPWDPSAANGFVAAMQNGIVAELRASAADQGVVPLVPASFRSSADNCSAISR